MQESLSSTSLSSMPCGHDTNSECADSGCANSAFHLWLSALDDDAAAVFANASADQVLQLTGRASEQPGEAAEPTSAVFVAVGACCAGSGGLTWEATQHSAVVRAKYRMMAAMLKDDARNHCFAHAIERRVREQQRRTGQPPLVLDIGTGSGFLGMIAARAGAQVIACEMNEPMAALARQVVAHNGLSARMEVRAVRSDALSLEDLGGRKADLVVSETLDSELPTLTPNPNPKP